VAGGAVLGFGGAYEATKTSKAARFCRAWAMRTNGGAAWIHGGAARFGMVCGLLFCLMNQRLSADSENFSRHFRIMKVNRKKAVIFRPPTLGFWKKKLAPNF